MPDPCIFCAIAAGDEEAAKVFEDDLVLVFVDLAPIRRGHLQIIPKQHYACFEDLPPEIAARIVHVGQWLARCLKQLYQVQRVGFVFSGNDVAHTHAHLLPLHEKTDITSRRYIADPHVRFVACPRASLAERKDIAEEIKAVSRKTLL